MLKSLHKIPLLPELWWMNLIQWLWAQLPTEWHERKEILLSSWPLNSIISNRHFNKPFNRNVPNLVGNNYHHKLFICQKITFYPDTCSIFEVYGHGPRHRLPLLGVVIYSQLFHILVMFLCWPHVYWWSACWWMTFDYQILGKNIWKYFEKHDY